MRYVMPPSLAIAAVELNHMKPFRTNPQRGAPNDALPHVHFSIKKRTPGFVECPCCPSGLSAPEQGSKGECDGSRMTSQVQGSLLPLAQRSDVTSVLHHLASAFPLGSARSGQLSKPQEPCQPCTNAPPTDESTPTGARPVRA